MIYRGISDLNTRKRCTISVYILYKSCSNLAYLRARQNELIQIMQAFSTCKGNSTRVLVRNERKARQCKLVNLGLSKSSNNFVIDKFLSTEFSITQFSSLNTSKRVCYKAIVDCLASFDKSAFFSGAMHLCSEVNCQHTGGKKTEKENINGYLCGRR